MRLETSVSNKLTGIPSGGHIFSCNAFIKSEKIFLRQLSTLNQQNIYWVHGTNKSPHLEF